MFHVPFSILPFFRIFIGVNFQSRLILQRVIAIISALIRQPCKICYLFIAGNVSSTSGVQFVIDEHVVLITR